ncbi:MAG: hypothetical protein EXR01_01410 [Acetobacteraceae bacterium]|nr:hypothetical protein [Acetobacteraceae bacterium]
MAYASSRSRERARRRKVLILRIGRWVVMLGVFLGIGYASYEAGLALAELRVVVLRRDLAEVTRERDKARGAGDTAQAALNRANEHIASLQSRYDADVPKDAIAALLQQARERIQEDIPPERLGEAMRAVRPVTACEGRPISKRFAVRATGQPGTDDGVTFADGLIGLSVTVNADDPARPLNASFTRLGGSSSVVSGPAPLRYVLIVDNTELRFTITHSDLRGFVIATTNSCGR